MIFHSYGDKGHALIFVHGWAMNSGVWEAQTQRFSGAFRVIAVNLPGHGGAPTPDRPLTVRSCADELVRLAGALPGGRVNLVGWSLGAQIACLAALELGARRVASVALVGGTPCFTAPPAEPAWGTPAGKLKKFRRDLESDFNSAYYRFIEGFFEPEERASPETSRRIERAFPDGGPLPDKKSALELLDDFGSTDLRGLIKEMETPCLICHGGNDKIVPAGVVDVWKGLLPSAKVAVFKGRGHVPFLTEPAPFNAILGDFIGSAE